MIHINDTLILLFWQVHNLWFKVQFSIKDVICRQFYKKQAVINSSDNILCL